MLEVLTFTCSYVPYEAKSCVQGKQMTGYRTRIFVSASKIHLNEVGAFLSQITDFQNCSIVLPKNHILPRKVIGFFFSLSMFIPGEEKALG